MLQLAFRNKYLVIVMALLVAVIGIVALQKLPVDILPAYKSSAVQILTLYPGMPAEVMEKDLTSRLERWTGQASGVERQESKSMIGVSILKDYFRPEIDPNTALSQVTSLAMSDLYYLPPGTIPPMVMPFDPTASIPLALLAVSSDSLSEKELYDIAYFQLRNLLGSVQGIIAPAVFGGKLRRIYMYVYPDKLQAYHLSQTDVMQAVQQSNVMIPTGDVNIGNLNYSVNANGMLPQVEDFNRIVIKMGPNGAPVYLQDIGYAKDASAIQTNIVHINGKRQVYIPIYKRPGANTIAAIESVKGKLTDLKARLPRSMNLDVILDQSTYVRHAINGLVREGVTGLVLVSLALLFFLGSFRGALIAAISIPLSILFGFIGLYFTGDSINSMTLGGIALAIGLLVDDSIVVLENIDRHIRTGKTPALAAREGAAEVAMPVLVTTITVIVVFFPIVFLTGIAKYLFTPLAVVVSLAMIGSRIFSMTLVPIAAAALFKGHGQAAPIGPTPQPNGQEPPGAARRKDRIQLLTFFDRGIQGLTRRYGRFMDKVLAARWWILGAVALLLGITIWGFGQLGTELFPKMDVGQFTIDVRLESGTRIERTEETITRIEQAVRHELGGEWNSTISNMGVLNDWPAAYTPNSGTQDATMAIQLKQGYKTPVAVYVQRLRVKLSEQFPGVEFIFNTGGIITSALNFGLPSPIDVQVTGNDLQKAHEIAMQVRDILRQVDGAEDVRIDQRYDHPEIKLDIDRTKAAELGIPPENIVQNTVATLNSTANFKPSFWVDERNGNHYFVGVTYPEANLDDPQSIGNISLTAVGGKTALLKNIAKTSLSSAPLEINHINIQRMTDIYANVEGRDIGSVAAEIGQKLDTLRRHLPEGYSVTTRGEVQSMKEAAGNLGVGLVLAILLVYLVIVPLLRSFKLPLIIITAIPLGLTGVVWTLLATHTYLNIPSMMGIIMMVGITVAYSNLLVDKINNLKKEGRPLREAIREGAANRLRPIMMTAIVTILALLPMALGYEIGGEANTPLARAIIGGVLAAVLLSLFVVPVLFYLFHKKITNPMPTSKTLLFLLPFGLLFFSSCHPGSSAKPDSSSGEPSASAPRSIPSVLVSAPQIRTFHDQLSISGIARPNQVVRLFAMTSGYLQQLRADIGDFVKAGQVVAVLENPELIRDKEQVEADLAAKKALYERLHSIYERTPQLTSIADVEKAQADYEKDKAQLNGLLLQIGYLNVQAPFSGVITHRFADKGAIIQSGLNNTNAMALFELQDLNPIRLEVDIPETDAVLIDKNTTASVSFPELPGATWSEKVSRFAYGLDTDTRTMRVEIDVPNKGLTIRPGMYARVVIGSSGHKDVLSIPNEAIGNVKGQAFLYAVDGGKVRKVPVTTGVRDERFTEILTGRVSAADSVIVQGKELVSDGASVHAREKQ